jgi:hypothetical protein
MRKAVMKIPEGAPSRLADVTEARMKEGPLPSPQSWEKRPCNRLYKPGDWSNGMTPGLTNCGNPGSNPGSPRTRISGARVFQHPDP